MGGTGLGPRGGGTGGRGAGDGGTGGRDGAGVGGRGAGDCGTGVGGRGAGGRGAGGRGDGRGVVGVGVARGPGDGGGISSGFVRESRPVRASRSTSRKISFQISAISRSSGIDMSSFWRDLYFVRTQNRAFVSLLMSSRDGVGGVRVGMGEVGAGEVGRGGGPDDGGGISSGFVRVSRPVLASRSTSRKISFQISAFSRSSAIEMLSFWCGLYFVRTQKRALVSLLMSSRDGRSRGDFDGGDGRAGGFAGPAGGVAGPAHGSWSGGPAHGSCSGGFTGPAGGVVGPAHGSWSGGFPFWRFACAM